MRDKDLINKFDNIEDLPISEEMLGAYLEGRLTGSEMREIQNLIHNDGVVANFTNMLEDEFTKGQENIGWLLNYQDTRDFFENNYFKESNDLLFSEINLPDLNLPSNDLISTEIDSTLNNEMGLMSDEDQSFHVNPSDNNLCDSDTDLVSNDNIF